MSGEADARPNPYEVIPYEKRKPGGEQAKLVEITREAIYQWRRDGYEGASSVSKELLNWWFETGHLNSDGTPFRYYFGQREAVETAIWFYEVKKARLGEELAALHPELKPKDFTAHWPRYVIKMATGSGKTKVMSLLLAWSWFNKFYNPESSLARNFLIFAPNLIVLERLRKDFEGNAIFRDDPVLPSNGHEGRKWWDDFMKHVKVHIQDEGLRANQKLDNVFLTNIQQAYYREETEPSLLDADKRAYFLGRRAVASTTDSDMGLRDVLLGVNELLVLNDEAHHIHKEDLAWYQAIDDIHLNLVRQKRALALQLDFTATPRDGKGKMFPEVISNYPLAEATRQGVVKQLTIPDEKSRAKLMKEEKNSVNLVERFRNYIELGVLSWRKDKEIHTAPDKKPILFIMTDDTTNCDLVAAHLWQTYPDFSKESVLVIHTDKKGEIKKADLKKLREDAAKVDKWNSPYQAIVSVLMLREGWDVKNVTTIVGLRAFNAPSKILPEQTVGRGLRLMYPQEEAQVLESVYVLGSQPFMEIVNKLITIDGVEANERDAWKKVMDLYVEVVVDKKKGEEELDRLNFMLPVLASAALFGRPDLADLEPSTIPREKIELIDFKGPKEAEIVFEDLVTRAKNRDVTIGLKIHETHHAMMKDTTRWVMQELGLEKCGGDSVVYGKLQDYIENDLFEGEAVAIENENVLRNLSGVGKLESIVKLFKEAYKKLQTNEVKEETIGSEISLLNTPSFSADNQEGVFKPKKSVFSYVVGAHTGGGFERKFAKHLDDWSGVEAFAEIHTKTKFKISYTKIDEGKRADYTPDFIVRGVDGEIYIIETKGREVANDVAKRISLYQWCETINRIQDKETYTPLYVLEEKFWDDPPGTFGELVARFKTKGK